MKYFSFWCIPQYIKIKIPYKLLSVPHQTYKIQPYLILTLQQTHQGHLKKSLAIFWILVFNSVKYYVLLHFKNKKTMFVIVKMVDSSYF